MAKKTYSLKTASIICVLSVVIMAAALVFSKGSAPAEFTPPPFDADAVQGVPSVPADSGWGEIDAKAFRASVCGKIIVTDGTADIWLTNPVENEVWLKLRVLDSSGGTIGETGLIRPGEYVQTLQFDTVPRAGESIGLKLMAYEPETYYSAGSAILNTTVLGGK